jgi:hypothetical protein
MSNQIIKKYKGERATQRGIAEMARQGYEVDQMASRKAMYSLATGLFTHKQINTIVFTKSASGGPEPMSEQAKAFSSQRAASMTFLQESLGLKLMEIRKLGRAHDANVDQLVELYWAGELPEVGIPDRAADEVSASTSSPPAPEPTQAAPGPTQAVGSVADEITKLAALRDSGNLTADEFEAQKAKLLAS